MANRLDEYMEQYEEAIAPGIQKGAEYVVRPEIWIYFKWTEDAGVVPWETVKFQQALENEILQDPEFGEVLLSGMVQAMAMTEEVSRNENDKAL